MFRWFSLTTVFSVSLLTLFPAATAAEWFVAPGGSGDGSSAAPFGSVQDGMDVAQPGDVVTVRAGTYTGVVETRRDGSSEAPITLRAESGAQVVIESDHRALRVDHAWFIAEGVIFDGRYGDRDTVDANAGADHFVLRNCEVRRSGRDCIDMGPLEGVRIEGCLIHHCLQWDSTNNQRVDAHGIAGAAMHDLIIRNTEIHTFSGDAVQLDPGREPPGWGEVLIEGCAFWLGPLTEDANGFTAGTVPGENAIDTKTDPDSPRATMTIVDTVAYGFRGGLISNMAAFNMKENIDATFDRVTVYDSEIAFRLRGPGSRGGAWVTVQNAVVYDVDVAVRYEDEIEQLNLFNSTFGSAVGAFFVEAQADNAGLDVRNLLLLSGSLPDEAGHESNLAVDDSAFLDAGQHNYHLADDSLAVDQGNTIDSVTHDRDGVSRPQGQAYDVGAYEFIAGEPDAGIDAGLDAGPDAGHDAGQADALDAGSDPGPADPGNGSDEGGESGDPGYDAGADDPGEPDQGTDCGCSSHPAGLSFWLILLPLAFRRSRS